MKKQLYPAFIYEPLPYFYLAGGVLALASRYNWLTWAAGLIFLLSGMTVAFMRYQYRKPVQLSTAIQKLQQPQWRSALNIKWHKSFECGETKIDEQHRHLFDLGCRLIHALATHQHRADIEWLLTELVDHIAYHFRIEETLLAELNKPVTPEHHATHQTLLAKAQHLQQRYHRHQINDEQELIKFIVRELIYDHIVKEAAK